MGCDGLGVGTVGAQCRDFMATRRIRSLEAAAQLWRDEPSEPRTQATAIALAAMDTGMAQSGKDAAGSRCYREFDERGEHVRLTPLARSPLVTVCGLIATTARVGLTAEPAPSAPLERVRVGSPLLDSHWGDAYALSLVST
jgi:hypothetical protein